MQNRFTFFKSANLQNQRFFGKYAHHQYLHTRLVAHCPTSWFDYCDMSMHGVFFFTNQAI